MKITPDSRVMYIDKTTNEYWESWKIYKDCSKDEKNKINLASYPTNCILFDKDLPTIDEKNIMEDYEQFKNLLLEKKIRFFTSWRSPHGYHILVPFDNMDNFSNDLKREIKAIYIKIFNCDPAKISDKGIVSLPNKPHFKDGKIYRVLEDITGINKINDKIVESAKTELCRKREQLSKLKLDRDFDDYFEKDKFWLILNNINWEKMPMSCGFNNIISKNLAIASAKTGLSKGEIDKKLKIFIKKIKGYNYSEFEGWLSKALEGELTDYNPYEINDWTNKYTDVVAPYDLSPTPIDINEQLQDKKITKKFITDRELEESQDPQIEWVINKWIPCGDICFIAGKTASYKTTLTLHMIYAISQGKLVFNNYNTQKSNILYINEENYRSLFKKIVRRVKKGLDLEATKLDNVYFSIMENLRLENIIDVESIINFVNKNNINIIVFDSFRRFFIGEENDAGLINRIFNTLKIIRTKCNDVTIILLHNTKKGSMYGNDARDTLRGSSDIVNAADSVIHIKRKIGQNYITIQHIKNRAGEEIIGKVIKIDMGENKDQAYIYEVEEEIDKTKILSEPEKCADNILQYLEDKKLSVFTKSDLKELLEKYKSDTITKALRILKDEETLTSSGAGRYSKYSYNLKKDEQKKL